MNYLCMACLRDDYLRNDVLKTQGRCDYCGASGAVIELQIVANACMEALSTHFETTHDADSVVIFDRSPAGKDLSGTLRSLNVVVDNVLDDLVEATLPLWMDHNADPLGLEDVTDDPWFQLRSDLHWRVGSEWDDMEESLRHEARHMNRRALDLLRRVFANLHAVRTDVGTPVVVEAGPGCSIDRLVRARVFQTESALEDALQHPARYLGTPTAAAALAGRMNAKGQPAFYGATDADVALAEVRPPVGALVATVEFLIIRRLKLLDLAALAKVQLDKGMSLFDPGAYLLAQNRDFLRTLSQRLVQPVMPELQDRDYVVTQVVADFLAEHEEGPIDGILYPSVQLGSSDGGGNVVLFPRASLVEGASSTFMAEVELWEYEDDGPGRWLSPVIEWPDPGPAGRDPRGSADGRNAAARPPALRIDHESICIHQVQRVSVMTRSHSVKVKPSTRSAGRR